jgi:uncharacterized protein involved in type VI secretion and phage assembly
MGGGATHPARTTMECRVHDEGEAWYCPHVRRFAAGAAYAGVVCYLLVVVPALARLLARHAHPPPEPSF